jgi:TIR domain-containing protein
VAATLLSWGKLAQQKSAELLVFFGVIVWMHLLARPIERVRPWWGALHGAACLFLYVSLTLGMVLDPGQSSNDLLPLGIAISVVLLLVLASGFLWGVIYLARWKTSPARPREVAGELASLPPIPSPSWPEPRPRAAAPPPREEPLARPPEPAAWRVMVSYRRSDSNDITGRIYDRLTQAFGRDAVFKDVDSIPFGVDFRHHLQEAVSRCQAVLVVIGKSWVEAPDERGGRRLDDARDFVRIEVETALQRGVPVIPLLVKGASIPDEEELPPSLQDLAFRNGLAIRDDPDFHRDMDRLIRDLERHFGGKARQRVTPR